MIQTEPELLMIAEYLRQMAATYVIGRGKEREWKRQFIKQAREMVGLDKKSVDYRRLKQNQVRILKELEEFYDAEVFWFGEEYNIDEFFEKYSLNLLGWSTEYFKRKVRAGEVVVKNKKGELNAYNTRTQQVERKEVLDDLGGGEGHARSGNSFRGRDGRAFRTGSGDCPEALGEAVALAGCVC